MIAGSVAGGPAWAQAAASPPPTPPALPSPSPAAGTVSLRAALDAAWQRAVAARESDGQRRRADAERAASAALWAAPPSLELSHRDDRLHGREGRREAEIGIAVPLWLPGQRTARAGTADAALAQASAGEALARLRLAGEVREAAWQLALLRAEARQAHAQGDTLQQLADDTERRVRAGELAPADALAAHAEHLAAVAQQADARQRLQSAQARWALLTGLATAPELGAEAAGDGGDDAAGHETPDIAATHPELQHASASTRLARMRAELVRHSRRDAPELSFGLRQDMPGGGQASQGSVVVGLRLPLGTADRNRPLEAVAFSELDVAQAHELRLRERLDSDIATARNALMSARSQHAAEATRARLLRERAALMDKSFRAGETALPELLRALAAASQADTAATRQAAAMGLARARLQQALGLLP